MEVLSDDKTTEIDRIFLTLRQFNLHYSNTNQEKVHYGKTQQDLSFFANTWRSQCPALQKLNTATNLSVFSSYRLIFTTVPTKQSLPLSWIEKWAYWDLQWILHAIKVNLLVTAIRQNCRDYDNRGVISLCFVFNKITKAPCELLEYVKFCKFRTEI